jgi:hypothetical protein
VISPVCLAGCLLLLGQGGASSEPSPRESTPAPGSTQGVGENPVDATLRSLRSPAASQDREVFQLAFGLFREEVDAYRLDSALRLALAIHESAGETWSAMSLSLLQTRLGLAQAARSTLSNQIALTTPGPDRTDLQELLGLAHLGAGRRGPALVSLGRAWLADSVNAGQALGALALSEGRVPSARRILGSLLSPPSASSSSPPPWALRGWGLAMVGAATEPVRREAPAPPRIAPRRATSASKPTTR